MFVVWGFFLKTHNQKKKVCATFETGPLLILTSLAKAALTPLYTLYCLSCNDSLLSYHQTAKMGQIVPKAQSQGTGAQSPDLPSFMSSSLASTFFISDE